MNVEPKPIREWVDEGARQFESAGLTFGQGYSDAWDEAAALVLHACGLPPDADTSVGATLVSSPDGAVISALFERRLARSEPVAYLIGEAWFAGLSFAIDDRALIPRSPIAELIETNFQPWLRSAAPRVLDMCTGGGCIAVATAIHLPNARVTGVDLSVEALEIANENARRHAVTERCDFQHSDLFAGLGRVQYDLIVTNPPYVSQAEYDALAPEFSHEPGAALVAGPDGLDIALRILATGVDYLSGDGILIMEVGQSSLALDTLLRDMPWTWLEFARGGDGVLLLEAADWREHAEVFFRHAKERHLVS